MHPSIDAPSGHRHVAVVIEDDPDIRDLIITVFQKSGFTVESAADGEAGVESVRQHEPTVVTLDLGLPGIDGFEVARRIRALSDCYIIIVSAQTDEAETLMGLAAGADDFITKPFRPRELRARIAAMLRRPRINSPATPPGGAAVLTGAPAPQPTEAAPRVPTAASSSAVFSHKGLVVDPATRSARLNDDLLSLTRTEFDLLETLMSSGRRVRTKANLVRHLRADHHGADSYVSDADERAVEVHIANLRRKLGQTGKSQVWIETIRGVGYRMSADQ
ncbi:response regulator transcription factor [Nesterenkonia ebinurensis]|uniref:response regulator transcription factor n=1 Tax=Nesterenkonia ebinurensis TaxID=2608252 RepID=UPI00295F493A|nr:response regulator transcription factor [Nesterenkonia ebinurensis]